MQLVTLGLAGEKYGIDIDDIHEIIMDQEPTRVPNLPSFLKGIINLRNNVIPIVEGTERIGYSEEESPPEGDGKIFIVKYEDQLIGIRVESAYKVVNVTEENIQSSPEMIDQMGGEFVEGVVEQEAQGRSIDSEESRRSNYTDSEPADESTRRRKNSRQVSQEGEKENILILNLDALFTGEEIEKIRTTREEVD